MRLGKMDVTGMVLTTREIYFKAATAEDAHTLDVLGKVTKLAGYVDDYKIAVGPRYGLRAVEAKIREL